MRVCEQKWSKKEQLCLFWLSTRLCAKTIYLCSFACLSNKLDIIMVIGGLWYCLCCSIGGFGGYCGWCGIACLKKALVKYCYSVVVVICCDYQVIVKKLQEYPPVHTVMMSIVEYFNVLFCCCKSCCFFKK